MARMRSMRPRLRAPIATSGSTPPPSGAVIETVTLDNFSGASRTDPYITFARDFEAGDVPSGSIVELQYGGSAITLQQADSRVLHDDGSLRRAVFSCKPVTGSVADNATIDIDLVAVTGSWSNPTTISRSTLTAQDYKMRVRIGGVDYYCLLNNLDAAATYRERRAGSAVRAWHHWGIFRAGQLAGDADQGQFQGHFYSYVWSDGTITVFPYLVNGRVANGSAATVQEVEFLNGASSIQLVSTSFTCYQHTATFLCATDGLPHWSANATHFHPRADALYHFNKKHTPHFYSTSAQRAAMTAPTAITYTPATPAGDIGTNLIDTTGGSPWVGHMSSYATKAMLLSSDGAISAATRKAALQNDRINALAAGVKMSAWFINHTTGMPPVLVNNNYTAVGLSAAQTSIGWGSAATITSTGGLYAGAVTNASHQPSYGNWQMLVTGWEWWVDFQIAIVVGNVGGGNPGTAQDYTRNPLIGGVVYYAGWFQLLQSRENAWRLRDMSILAWAVGDDHPCKAYMGQLITNGNAIVDAFMSGTVVGDRANLGILPGTYGSMSSNGAAPWQLNYLLVSISNVLRRGQVSASHKLITECVTKYMVGFVNCCPYRSIGMYAISLLEGSTGSAGTIAGSVDGTWNNVYGSDGGLDTFAGQTAKVVADAGGVSGSCPISGSQRAWDVGHNYPNITQGALNMISAAGVSPGAALPYIETLETAAGASEAAWAAVNPQWRIRAP